MEKPSLLDMTDVPMTNILEQCDFKSVLTLRKVCHSLRNFIDDTNIRADSGEIHVTITSAGISLIFLSNFFATCDLAKKRTSYDMNIMYYLQNLTIGCLRVDTKPGNSRVLTELQPILKQMPRPFRTEKLEMGISNCSEVAKVLPYLDTTTLKRIELSAPKKMEGKILVGLDKIMEVEQYKKAIGFTVNGFLVKEKLREFFYFQRIRMKFKEISEEDLMELKKAFTTSTHMKHFPLEDHNMNVDTLEELFDVPPFKDAATETKAWYFKIEECKEHVLKVEFVAGKLVFRRENIGKVPKKAKIRN